MSSTEAVVADSPGDVFDYVVIGAGSAGSVVAGRLAEQDSGRVLVLEAGPADHAPAIHVPAGLMKLDPDKLYWRYEIEPDASRQGRRDLWAAGRVTGGGSSVNAMLWVRGNRADFDTWAELGATGWDYESVLPYMRSLERFERGASTVRGGEGPQRVSLVRLAHPLVKRWLAAAHDVGLPFNEDYNGISQLGAAWSQLSQRRGLRHSAARAFLAPAVRRRRLKLVTHATAQRVLFDGTRAVGVAYTVGVHTRTAFARKEVILCAGALESPAILLRSGIGDPDDLRPLGIEVVADVPAVGRNLQEHPTITLTFDVTERTLNQELTPLSIARAALDFVARGRGAATAPLSHAVAFERLHDAGWPTYEAMFSPLATSTPGPDVDTDTVHSKQGVSLATGSVVSTFISLLHPKSRGSVTLRSADPRQPPLIECPFLADDGDVADLIAAGRRVREIMDAPSMRSHVIAESSPGPGVRSDREWEEFIRATAHGACHWVGTARIGGPDDPEAVVDPQLRVRGVHRLRVVDASVMPTLTSGNTNAPSILIGEKGAALIRRASGATDTSQSRASR
jgi:choline dehydrogenase